MTRSGATLRAMRQRPSVPSDPSAGSLVLTGDQGQQRHRLGLLLVQLDPLKLAQQRQRVGDQGRDQQVSGDRVIPGDVRLGAGGVVMPGQTRDHRPGYRNQGADAADLRDQLGHSVLTCDGIIEDRRVQGATLLAGQHPGGQDDFADRLEDPVWTGTGRDPASPVRQHRRVEPGLGHREPARSLPPQVERDRLRGLPVRQPVQRLQHHHRGDHIRRDGRTPPPGAKQVRERLIRKQSLAILGQERKHRPRWQQMPSQRLRIPELTLTIITTLHTHRISAQPDHRTRTHGLFSSLLAVGILLEGTLEPHLNVPFVVDLWLSGVVEETIKIAVPVLLLIVARERFGDPRVGVLMVLISSAVFGVGEGIQYVASGSGSNNHLLMGLVRPVVEVAHPLWATIAAGAIWLAAHRSGRVITWAGFAGWFVAVALHSIHDGVLGGHVRGTHNHSSDINVSVTQAVADAVVVNAIGIVLAVVTFLILSQVLREIVPPSAVAKNPPHWRPRLALWGVPRATRTQWEAEQPVVVVDNNGPSGSQHTAGHQHGRRRSDRHTD